MPVSCDIRGIEHRDVALQQNNTLVPLLHPVGDYFPPTAQHHNVLSLIIIHSTVQSLRHPISCRIFHFCNTFMLLFPPSLTWNPITSSCLLPLLLLLLLFTVYTECFRVNNLHELFTHLSASPLSRGVLSSDSRRDIFVFNNSSREQTDSFIYLASWLIRLASDFIFDEKNVVNNAISMSRTVWVVFLL